MKAINIIFADDTPDTNDMLFVEIENDSGQSINIGKWITKDGYAVLRITEEDVATS